MAVLSYSQVSNIDELKTMVAEVSRNAFARHLIGGTGGNISARLAGEDRVVVTPSGLSLADLTEETLVICDLEGQVLEAPQGLKPSKETYFHLGIYSLRPSVNAVVHVHPVYSTAYANLLEELPLSTVSAQVKLARVPCIDTALPGSDELREQVLEAVRTYPDSNAFLMREHGILTVAESLYSAFYAADLVEDTAQIAYAEAVIRSSTKASSPGT